MNRTLRSSLLSVAAAVPLTFLSMAAVPAMESAKEDDAAAAIASDDLRREGRITGWQVDKDGDVYFRLEGEDANGKAFRLWFVTPPSQTATTEFERLVLQIVLELTGADAQKVIVHADDSNDAGRTIEDALELVSIARR